MTAIGLLTYPVVRPALSRSVRWTFIVVAALAIAVLVIPDVIRNFGPEPYMGMH
jgi:hypothetical protein